MHTQSLHWRTAVSSDVYIYEYQNCQFVFMANKPSKFDHHTNNAHTCPHTHIYIYMYIYKVIKKNCKHLLSTMEFLTMLTLYSSYEGGGGGLECTTLYCLQLLMLYITNELMTVYL